MIGYFFKELTNVSLLYNRHFDGVIVSMHQSGSHWIKHILTSMFVKLYGLEEPKSINSFDIIGHPKVRPVYKDIPQIVHSHSIAHPLMYWPATHKLFSLPKYLLLVRDIRSTLESHYAREKKFYGDATFSEFLRGGKRFNKDIWWDIRFLNAWARVMDNAPDRVCVVRYEDLQKNANIEIERICSFFNIAADKEDIEFSVRNSTKDKMNNKNGYNHVSIVRMKEVDTFSFYNDSDRAFIRNTLNKHLVHDFGYDYDAWSEGK